MSSQELTECRKAKRNVWCYGETYTIVKVKSDFSTLINIEEGIAPFEASNSACFDNEFDSINDVLESDIMVGFDCSKPSKSLLTKKANVEYNTAIQDKYKEINDGTQRMPFAKKELSDMLRNKERIIRSKVDHDFEAIQEWNHWVKRLQKRKEKLSKSLQ